MTRYDAFLSYAREDAPFALALLEMLRRGGFDIWIDEERIAGGMLVEARIYSELRQSEALLCLVSRAWLDSENCYWEGKTFSDEFGQEGLIIPLLRVPWSSAGLPAYFTRRKAIDWLQPKPSEALFWQVRCALLSEPPGPTGEWLEKGRALLGLSPSPQFPARRPVEQAEEEARHRSRLGYDRAALLCDRDPQWQEIGVHAGLDHHVALFVQGARIEAPDLFLDAVERCFPDGPVHQIVPVPWTGSGPNPYTGGELRCGLASALGCDEPDLERTLRHRLRDSNLVLVHKPVLQEDLEEEPLQDYYCRILPALLRASGETRGSVKVFQGIAWAPVFPVTRWLARVADLLWPWRALWIERALEKYRAKRALKSLGESADPLRLICLERLRPIRKKHVVRWSKTLRPGIDSAAAVRAVLRRARTSAEILARAATYGNPR